MFRAPLPSRRHFSPGANISITVYTLHADLNAQQNVLFIGGANIQSVVFVHREQLGLPTYFGLAPSIHLRRRRTHALLKLTKSEYTACVSRRSMWTKTIYWFRNATNYKARNQSTEHLDTDAPELCRLLVTKKAVDR